MVFYRPLDQMYLSTHPPCGFGWIDGHVTSRNQGLSFNDQGRQRRETLGTRLDQIIRKVIRLGRGALMAKFDVEVAYRNIPVHPTDRVLLDMKWRGKYYVDLVLPFGLRSAPNLFSSARGDGPGPLLRFQSGQPLSRPVLTSWLREILATAGVPGNFSIHSFRIGAATVAVWQGIPDHLIQALGRWTSNAYQLYIRTPAEALTSLSSQLFSHPVRRDHHF